MSRYESDKVISQYLLFHYGTQEETLPYPFGPHDALDFPMRSVIECLDVISLPVHAKALELGCAVGRASFELSRYCDKVVAVDKSQAFISAAKHIQEHGQLEYKIAGEGTQEYTYYAKLPHEVDPTKIEFRCEDVMNFESNTGKYDVVLAANILCRLPDPQKFLRMLGHLVQPGGQLILISPYTWLEEFTSRDQWLVGVKKPLEIIENHLKETFELQDAFNMPFLLRETIRKYEWCVSQASLWKRKS